MTRDTIIRDFAGFLWAATVVLQCGSFAQAVESGAQQPVFQFLSAPILYIISGVAIAICAYFFVRIIVLPLKRRPCD